MELDLGISFEKLVQRINELSFDFSSKEYQRSHPEIFIHERERWKKIANNYLKTKSLKKILDIGTGSGFVPLTIASSFKKSDLFICSDISKKILEIAKNNIIKENFKCKFKYTKIEPQIPYRLPFKSDYFNIITMNSLLHHINDINEFLIEIDRILKPNGILVITHEPNRHFYENWFLWTNYIILKNFLTPRHTIKKYLKRIFKNSKKNTLDSYNDQLSIRINEILLKEKLIIKPLSLNQIDNLKDIRALEGFYPKKILPNYKLIFFETYNHLFNLNIDFYNNFLVRKYDTLLKRLFPNKGSQFLMILRKKINYYLK